MADADPTKILATWSQKRTDFTIAMKSGEKVKVHQHILAENSEVFETMLDQEFVETKKKEMSIEQFDTATVVSFLEYLYAGSIDDPKTLERIKAGSGPGTYIYKRSFDQGKLTLDLLRMAHMYQVEDLKLDCYEHLEKTVCDDNAVELLKVAHTFENKRLSSVAISHLVDGPQAKPLREIPGFKEAFQSHGEAMQALMEAFAEKTSTLKRENADLKETCHWRSPPTDMSRICNKN